MGVASLVHGGAGRVAGLHGGAHGGARRRLVRHQRGKLAIGLGGPGRRALGLLLGARELERQTRAGAEDYADEVFGHVEQSLDTLLNNVRRCRDRLNANAMAQGRQ